MLPEVKMSVFKSLVYYTELKWRIISQQNSLLFTTGNVSWNSYDETNAHLFNINVNPLLYDFTTYGCKNLKHYLPNFITDKFSISILGIILYV